MANRLAVSPKHVVLLAEYIPTWLSAIDTWGAEMILLYCKKEIDWYRRNLELITPLTPFPTVVGLIQTKWMKEKNE